MKRKSMLILVGVVIFVIIVLGVARKLRDTRESAPPGDMPGYASGDHSFNLVHDGLAREYLVHVPPSYNQAKPTPVVIALHGGGGNAKGSPAYFGLDSKADQEGFIVVYPQGSGKEFLGKTFGTWNAGRCCGTAMRNRIDDVGFIESVLEKVTTDFAVDEQRMFATGMSNGAQMAYRLACELSEKIAAVAPVGSEGTFDECQPTRPIPVLHIQGKADPCSLYEGGVCGGCMADFWNKIGVQVPDNDWVCQPIPAYVDTWRKRNGCSDKTNVTFQHRGATCNAYEQCEEDVVLCTVEGLGHNWPGQSKYGVEPCENNPGGKNCKIWKDAMGPLSQDLIANDKIWEFFKGHPRGDIRDEE